MTGLDPLLTVWGGRLDPDHPLAEYPRPQLVRDSYLNLNGRWAYAITGTAEPPRRFDGEIVVPFSPEARLSGVGRQLQPDEFLHYRRTFRLPDGFAGTASCASIARGLGTSRRLLLHFGAVDQWCQVTVNGAVVGGHTGGYLPFRFDITDALHDGENELRVVVSDPSDTGQVSRGKQRLARGGIWYTAQSGIWQTVWLEAVPETWIDDVVLTPDLPGAAVDVTVLVRQVDLRMRTPFPELVEGPEPVPAALRPFPSASSGRRGKLRAAPAQGPVCGVTLLADGEVVASAAGPAGTKLRLRVPDPRPWSPEDPFCYDVRITCGVDSVTSYLGIRSVGIGRDSSGPSTSSGNGQTGSGSGRLRLLLNGEPYFHAGVLDQGYWPDGLYTPPSDAALVHDIAIAKQLGFTMIRKHIKVEPLRWYAHCDRMGILVWQDMVNGGGPYQPVVIAAPAVVPAHLDDRRYDRFGRTDAAGRAHWLAEADATVELLRNSPAVAVWVPFNEGWGQFDAAAITQRVRRLDPTRPVDAASGWHDQGGGDIDSRHVYIRPFRTRRRWNLPGRRALARLGLELAPERDPDRVLALTEYGGYSRRVAGHCGSEREFGYRRFRSGAALARALRRLHDRQVVPAIRQGLAATVYTQLADVEDETNGLMTADRRVVKIPLPVLRLIFERLRLHGVGWPASPRGARGRGP